ncbi:LysE family translocator [Hydrogenophaga flava]|uniref:LysE family translocator n=1 Tax=Hydrogenophaga flava TaxID=65657 RepID=UPI0008241212|nr:LysE family transporter [Hydrogenophaga flava]
MLTTFLTIAVLHWVALVTPGVNFVLILQLAAGSPRSVSLSAAAGITTVTFLWALLAILGMGAAFSAHPALRQAFQIAGGAYLCYVAWKLWRAPAAVATEVKAVTTSRAAAFRMGFITNVFNPKTALFFGSVFATALPPSPGPAVLAGAVLLCWFNAVVWHVFLALAFSHGRVQSVYQRGRTVFNRGAAGLVGAFGLRLLVTTVQELRARV